MKLLIILACLALISATPVYRPINPFLRVEKVFELGFSPKVAFEVCDLNPSTNVVLSPASIFTALGLAYLGASGTTAHEMHTVMQFGAKTKAQVAQSYAEFMHQFQPQRAYSQVNFQIANRIFVDQKYELAPEFNQLAATYLQSSAERVNFASPHQAADKINSWVADNTNKKIQSIISADSIEDTTAAVLVNAIYFKAPWEHRFPNENTQRKNFFLNEHDQVPVDMMYQEQYLEYAIWNDLDATAVQIPFQDTDIYMLVVLPNRVNGLQLLEQKMRQANLIALREKFFTAKVMLSLPKFKFDFSITLSDVLKRLGLRSMFDNADFSNLLSNGQSVSLDEVIHKAFIAVDEIGAEASAATMVSATRQSAMDVRGIQTYQFNADHPFLFAIKNRNTVFFAGHVNTF